MGPVGVCGDVCSGPCRAEWGSCSILEGGYRVGNLELLSATYQCGHT
jgi:hypothetical protein